MTNKFNSTIVVTTATILVFALFLSSPDYTTDADALQRATGQHNQETRDRRICGDRLCSATTGSDSEREETLKQYYERITGVSQQPESKKQQQQKQSADAGSLLKLSRASVPANIPLNMGYYDGEQVYFIITDSSDKTHADIISEKQDWEVELAPPLVNTPKDALSTTYMFTNGVKGDGIHGYQGEVFTSTPATPEQYSALTSHVHVTWNDDATPQVLESEQEIMKAQEQGKVKLTKLPVVLNMPQIVWPGGQMKINENISGPKELTDSTPYGGGQVLDIDFDSMTVTFIAHRGWGPDGRTIYYIVTDATPKGPADMMGVVNSPTSASLINNAAAVDLFQFKNGIKGVGPLGFQPGIAASAPGDKNYSPMWRIHLISWGNSGSAKVLETMDDIRFYQKQGMISVNLARPMDSDHIVNCPFIDPFQNR